MPTIRQVDPETLKGGVAVATDPMGPQPEAPVAAGAAPANSRRLALPELPKIKGAFAESVNGELVVTVPMLTGGPAKMKAPNVALQLNIGQALGDSFSPYLWNVCKAVMYVFEVDGTKLERPRDRIELQKSMNKLGDVGVELVMAAYRDFFGVIIEADQLPLSDPQ